MPGPQDRAQFFEKTGSGPIRVGIPLAVGVCQNHVVFVWFCQRVHSDTFMNNLGSVEQDVGDLVEFTVSMWLLS